MNRTQCSIIAAILTSGSLAASAHAGLIIGEADNLITTVDFVAPGWDATITAGGPGNGSELGGSNDGTWGSSAAVLPAPPTTGGGHSMKRGDANYTITITNNTGAAVKLDSLLFDAAVDAPDMHINVNYLGGGLGATPFQLGTTGNLTVIGSVGTLTDLDDFDFLLDNYIGAGMFTTTTLGAGLSAIFELDPDGANRITLIDNVAITAADSTASVPEPATAALGMLTFGALALRRRKQRNA